MKFYALRSSVARLFETAATLVAPQGGALEDPNAPVAKAASAISEAAKRASMRDVIAPGPAPEPKSYLVVGNVTRGDDDTKAAGLPEAKHLDWLRNNPIDDKLMDDIEDMVRKAVPGADVVVRKVDAQGLPPNHDLKHIFDTAIKPPPDDDFPWSTWTGMMAAEAEHAPPGWAFCRIGNRKCSESGDPEDDIVEFTFGFARGSFGVWRKPFDICELVGGLEIKIKEGIRLLTVVTHLQSGTGMGLFFDMALAAEACELIERSVTDLNAFDPNKAESWSPLFNRMVSIWKAAGIRRAVTHAHVTGTDGEESPPIAIFERTKETMNYGRPEKLS